MLLEHFEVRTQKSSIVQNFISIVMFGMLRKSDRNTTDWKLRGIVIYDRICWVVLPKKKNLKNWKFVRQFSYSNETPETMASFSCTVKEWQFITPTRWIPTTVYVAGTKLNSRHKISNLQCKHIRIIDIESEFFKFIANRKEYSMQRFQPNSFVTLQRKFKHQHYK